MLSSFKPLNLPKFDRNGNLNNFVRIFENSMLGATDADKSSTIINCLDAASVELVIHYLPACHWTIKKVKDAIVKEFGHPKTIATKKMEFLSTSINTNNSFDEFADRFYACAQFLTGVGALSSYNTKIAMKNALHPYNEVYLAMIPSLVHNYKTFELVQFLERVGQRFGIPKPSRQKSVSFSKDNFSCDQRGSPFSSSVEFKSRRNSTPSSSPKDLSDVLCHCCSKKGHYAKLCPNCSGPCERKDFHYIDHSDNKHSSDDSGSGKEEAEQE